MHLLNVSIRITEYIEMDIAFCINLFIFDINKLT